MLDAITTLGGALVHHGPANDRAYLLKLAGANPGRTARRLETLAESQGYTKIIAKVPASAQADFAAAGYRSEAAVPRFYRGVEPVHFMAKYRCPVRRRAAQPDRIAQVLTAARNKAATSGPESLAAGFSWRLCRPGDAAAMAEVYRRVFATYPFPIHDPCYLRQTMAENVVYFGVWSGERLVALASAEMDAAAGNAEMTDFATLPECRGGGFATFLLGRMEAEMRRRGIRIAYTIARAVSFGMNITFARSGYRFTGTLTSNTNIAGSLECMNVWAKDLAGLALGDCGA